MLRAHHDFETASAIDLKKVGVHRYAAHPSTFIWCMGWRLGEGPIEMWRPGAPDPAPLLDHVWRGLPIVAHNAGFERTVWNALAPAHWPRISIEQQSCTLARAAVLNLPLGLDSLCIALRLPVRKDAEGSKTMKQMMRPRAVTPEGGYTWWDDDVRRARLETYCAGDVEAETQVDLNLPELHARERQVWELDQRINDRGVSLDRPVIELFQRVVTHAKRDLDDRMAALTDGKITTCNQTARIVQWINDHGVTCKSVAAEELDDIIEDADAIDDIELGAGRPSAQIKEALHLRSEASKSSTAKLKSMLLTMDDAGRSRGLLQYAGTIQDRWAGRLWQPHNIKTREDEEITDAQQALVLAGLVPDAKALALAYELMLRPPLEMVSLSLRSLIVAAKGKKLIGGDKSNIEGRINAWLAGEDWKIAAFHAYDAGHGPDLYRVAYASSFGVDIGTVTGARRAVGKVQELALGYQGSVGAYVKMARKKGVNLEKVRDTVKAAADPTEWLWAQNNYPSARNKAGLDIETWAAVSIVVKRWRKQNNAIVQGWWALQDAAIEAVANPGRMVPVFGARVRYLCARGFLFCSLPSNRVVSYPRPVLRTVDSSYLLFADNSRHDIDTFFEEEIAEFIRTQQARLIRREKHEVHFEVGNYEKDGQIRYRTKALYGGMQCAHVVSGIARDTLVDDMFEAERRGYEIVLTVHDELLSEVDMDYGSAAELQSIMSTKSPWIDGDLPLAAKCWEGGRYAK